MIFANPGHINFIYSYFQILQTDSEIVHSNANCLGLHQVVASVLVLDQYQQYLVLSELVSMPVPYF